ncbi:MAG TPA: type I-U CRISPR-associated protein Csx17 [Methanotrichaceae archaeon]|nr:type I-U CRISPR-associated protein Csx17 [Methanotrichaceae archaeon]
MTHIILKGCGYEPLSSYLSSLAVLRLISEQSDSSARGLWDNGVFNLESNLDENGLVQFFLEDYAPSPIVAPWNGGSGFYEGDKTEGIEAIRGSTSPRFALFKETIERIFSFPEMPPSGLTIGRILEVLEGEAKGKKGKAKEEILEAVEEVRLALESINALVAPEDLLRLNLQQLEERTKPSKKASQSEKELANALRAFLKPAKKSLTLVKRLRRGAGKEKIIQACRDRLSEQVIEWIDAAAIVSPEGDAEYSPILGSGGNEGRLEYTNTFMSNLAQLLLKPENKDMSRKLLRNALFGDATADLTDVKVGQYDPGHAGGYNQGQGIERKDYPANPWKFILTIEGSLAWASSVARRQASGRGFLRSPFTVRACPVGYSSSSEVEVDGQKARAEIWAPLWRQPVSYPELRTFLGEGRADVGRKPASNGIEFAEAASSLGVDRGVSEFARYSLLKRRGDSYVALPVGRFPVYARSESDLVRELDQILSRLDRFLQSFEQPPASFTSARRRIDMAIFNLLQHGGADRVKDLLVALGRMEQLIAVRDRSKKPKLNSPLAGLSPRWLVAADDGSVEVRIAIALASIRSTGEVGPIRSNLAPIDPAKPWTWAKGQGQVAWIGSSLAARIASVLARRMMDAQRLNCPSNPLWGEIPIRAEDITALIEGEVEENVVEDLLFGLTWVRWNDRDVVSEARRELMGRWSRPTADRIVPRSFALLKLLFLPGDIMTPKGDKIVVRPEASILPCLLSGRIGESCEIARHRLHASGLSPVRSQFSDIGDGTGIAAGLLLPVQNYKALAKLVVPEYDRKD